MVTWNTVDLPGAAVADIDSTQKFTLGQTCRARHVTGDYEGKFMYVKGVASNATGLFNLINFDTYAVTLLADGDIGPVGISMGALIASTFGWVQRSGKASGMVAAAVAENAALFISAAGVAIATASGKSEIVNARTAEAADSSSAGNIEVEIDEPFCCSLAGA